MRRILPLSVLFVACLAAPARGQSEAVLGVGACITSDDPTGRLGQSATSIGPLFRIKLGAGVGPTIGFDWYAVGVEAPVGDKTMYVGRVRVRPVMAGIAYNLNRGKYWLSASVVGGYAFNRLTAIDQARAAFQSNLGASSVALDATNSFVWRPQLGVWYDVAPRVGITASIARIGVHPTLRVRTNAGIERIPLDATSMVLTFGMVYGVF